MDSLKALAWLVAGILLAVCTVVVFDTVEQQLIAYKVPAVSAKCKDGTYSTAKRGSGACSRHGGVEVWIIR